MSSPRGSDTNAAVTSKRRNLFNLGNDGLEPVTRFSWRSVAGSLDQRLERGRRIVDICTEVFSVRKKTVLVEFTVQTGRRDIAPRRMR